MVLRFEMASPTLKTTCMNPKRVSGSGARIVEGI